MLSRPDAELVQRDSAVPGLALLLNPEAMSQVLNQALDRRDVRVTRTTYVRYKPWTSCLAGYELETDGGALTAYAKAYRPQAQDKFHAALARPSIPSLLGPGRLGLEEAAIVLSFFPNDQKLKTLGRLADEQLRHRLLKKLVPERPNLRDADWQELRYKPERRYVAQLLADGQAAAILKIYHRPEYQPAEQNALAFTPKGRLQLARLLGHSTRRRTLVFEWLTGQCLSELLPEPQAGPAVVTLVGEALAELHSQRPKQLRWQMPEHETESLLAVANYLGIICPQWARSIQSLAQQLALYVLRQRHRVCPIHGDFYADQVLVQAETIAILDLDQAAYGNPLADLSLFLAHLERAALYGELSLETVGQLKEALLAGYSRVMRRPCPRRLEAYVAIGLLRLAPHPFRRREADWPERIAAIIGRAQEILQTTATNASIFALLDRKESTDVEYSGSRSI